MLTARRSIPASLMTRASRLRAFVPGLLALGPSGIFGPYTSATEIDVDKLAFHASDPLVEPASTNLSTFSLNGGKLIFFHGDSDPWFSPLDRSATTSPLPKPRRRGQSGRMEPHVSRARNGALRRRTRSGSLRHAHRSSQLGREGHGPDSVIATGAAFPGRSRPLCPYPKHAQYSGNGDTQDARNFQCRDFATH